MLPFLLFNWLFRKKLAFISQQKMPSTTLVRIHVYEHVYNDDKLQDEELYDLAGMIFTSNIR
jgi:hypothetical protein